MSKWMFVALLLAGCPPESKQDAGSCNFTPVTVCPSPAPTYADVSPVFDAHCNICHTGQDNGPWPLNDYESVYDWSELIRSDLLDCTMPQADAGTNFTDDDRRLLLTWIRCGMPR